MRPKMDAAQRTEQSHPALWLPLAIAMSWTLGCEPSDVRPPDVNQLTAGGTVVERPAVAKKRPREQSVTFDDLAFDIERDGDFDLALLTDEIRALEGQPVVLRGFILAASVYQQNGIKQFVLVRDNQECCFGPGAYIYHNCQVECVPNVSTSFSIRPIAVHGTLRFKPLVGPDGKCLSVYHLTATRVE